MFKINKIVNNVKDSLQWDKGKGGSKLDIVKSIMVVSFLGLGLLLNISKVSCIPQVRSRDYKTNWCKISKSMSSWKDEWLYEIEISRLFMYICAKIWSNVHRVKNIFNSKFYTACYVKTNSYELLSNL